MRACVHIGGVTGRAGEKVIPGSLSATMLKFSANHLFFLSRKECRSCAVLLLLDRDAQPSIASRTSINPPPRAGPGLLRGVQGQQRR